MSFVRKILGSYGFIFLAKFCMAIVLWGVALGCAKSKPTEVTNYSLSVNVIDLSGTLVLTVVFNGSESPKTITSNGSNILGLAPETVDSSYTITVASPPTSQTCTFPSSQASVTGTMTASVELTLTCTDTSDSASASTIMLFSTSSEVDGDTMQDRTTANNLCTTAATTAGTSSSALTCPNGVVAFIGFDSEDSVADLPTTSSPTFSTSLAIVSTTYTDDGSTTCANNINCIADQWSTLMSGTILHSLDAASVFPVKTTSWWSGSTSSGIVITDNTCSSWTSGSYGGPTGEVGYSAAADSNWIELSPLSCVETAYLLCLCY